MRARFDFLRVRAQIRWGEEFDHETARELFSSNLLALTWIKGEPMPKSLVSDVLLGLGIERETYTQINQRLASIRRLRGGSSGSGSGLASSSVLA